MARRLLICGVAAFILTLAFSSWHDRRYDAAPVADVVPLPSKGSLVSPGAPPLNPPSSEAATTPTAAAAPAPAVTAMKPVIAPDEPAQSDPVANGATLVRRDRGAEPGSRSR